MPENEEKLSEGEILLRSWLNKNMRIKMTDGRVLLGVFVCTDKDQNVILSSCQEYLKIPDEDMKQDEARYLGLSMIPGNHITSIEVETKTNTSEEGPTQPLTQAEEAFS